MFFMNLDEAFVQKENHCSTKFVAKNGGKESQTYLCYGAVLHCNKKGHIIYAI